MSKRENYGSQMWEQLPAMKEIKISERQKKNERHEKYMSKKFNCFLTSDELTDLELDGQFFEKICKIKNEHIFILDRLLQKYGKTGIVVKYNTKNFTYDLGCLCSEDYNSLPESKKFLKQKGFLK